MRSAQSLLLLSASLLVLAGCGTPVDPHHGHAQHDAGSDVWDAGTQDAGTSGDDAGTGDGGTVDAGTTVVSPPVLLQVLAPGHSTMELSWQNPAAGCTTISIRRKPPGGSYSVVKTVAGTLTSTTDSPGHTSGTYCYTLVCTLENVASAPSNEKCATQ